MSYGTPGRVPWNHRRPSARSVVATRIPASRKACGEPAQDAGAVARAIAVDDQEDLGDAVRAGGLEQQVDALVDLRRRWQVDPRMEGLAPAERQHHDGVVRLEAEQDGHRREHVLGGAEGEDRAARGVGCLSSSCDRRSPGPPTPPGRARGPVETPRHAPPVTAAACRGPGVRFARARPRLGPPSGPGRVLRRRGAARQALAARQAGGGRRHRRPRGGGHGLVRARKYGVRSAMSTREARSRCPHAAFLSGRFHAYRDASAVVMALLREVSPLVEPLSLDEAFVDLEQAGLADVELPTVSALAERIRADVLEATGGLTASIGLGTSKFIAKVASDLDKPDGLVVVAPGTERDLLRPMSVTVIPGVGPATSERLRRVGILTVADLETVDLDELVRLVGKAHGAGLFELSRAQDDRPVVAERETKSVSQEGTYDTDLTDRTLMEHLLTRQAGDVATRLRKHGLSGRTVTIKVRMHDFTTLSRSTTLGSPTDHAGTIARLARGLLTDLDTSGGVRLLGVGVSGLADWVQEDLFGETEDAEEDDEPTAERRRAPRLPQPRDGGARRWAPGMDVVHDEMGKGWVWGSGRGVVTVRFETAETPAGPVRSYAEDDPALAAYVPENQVPEDGSPA